MSWRPLSRCSPKPSKVFNYNSGATELLAYIFQKETGQDIDAYGEKYFLLHLVLSITRSVLTSESSIRRVASTLRETISQKSATSICAMEIGDGRQIISKEWVKDSLTPHIDTGNGRPGNNFQYAFKWWLYPANGKFVWMARGFGGQRLMVFPPENLIVVLTGWEILEDPASTKDLIDRLLPAVKQTALHSGRTIAADSFGSEEGVAQQKEHRQHPNQRTDLAVLACT